MTPNLFLATQKAFSPHKWFKGSKNERPVRETEFWAEGPVPGLYEYIPGRGKYLVATLKDSPTSTKNPQVTEDNLERSADSTFAPEYIKLKRPIAITYSRAIKRWFLEPDFQLRKKQGIIKNDRGKNIAVGFFRTVDHGGVAWVQCWDERGTFIPGPYQKWCIDSETQQFRHMRHRDDPEHALRSRNNSSEREFEVRSQDSMSTGGYRDSRPSTRANSYIPSNPTSRPTSRVPSQRPSRQNSPVRNNSVPLEEAKAALRRMAREQEAKARLQPERGRARVRAAV